MESDPTIATAVIFILAYTAVFLLAWRISSGNSRTQAERRRDDEQVDAAVREVMRRHEAARQARAELKARRKEEVPR